jgi:hypothetical protein
MKNYKNFITEAVSAEFDNDYDTIMDELGDFWQLMTKSFEEVKKFNSKITEENLSKKPIKGRHYYYTKTNKAISIVKILVSDNGDGKNAIVLDTKTNKKEVVNWNLLKLAPREDDEVEVGKHVGKHAAKDTVPALKHKNSIRKEEPAKKVVTRKKSTAAPAPTATTVKPAVKPAFKPAVKEEVPLQVERPVQA